MSSEQSGNDVNALRARAGRATVWSLVGYGGAQVVRLASNLVLTRLLVAEHFGIMVLVNIFVSGLQLFSDIGIGPAIIRSERSDDPRLLNTAWTISVLRGFALWGVACLGAAPFAHLYHQEELLYLIPVVSVNAVLGGFKSSKAFTQQRDLTLGRMVAIDLTSQITGVVVMIVWAYWTRSLWALAGGPLVSTFMQALLSHIALPGVANRFSLDREIARRLFKFGRWVFISTALTFVAGQADRLVFGRLVSMAELGVYSIALVLASAPSAVLWHLNRTVVFPIYSRANQNGEDLAVIYNRARQPMLVMGGWVLSSLIAAGPSIVQLLYERPYWAAGWKFQLLAAGMWFGVVLEATNSDALLAQGLSQWTAASSLGKVVALCVLLPLGFTIGGFAGALVGLAASEFCRYLVSVYAARKRRLYGVRQDLKASGLMALSVASGALAAWAVHTALPSALLETMAAAAAATLVWSRPLAPYARQYLGRPQPASAAT